MYSLLSNIFIEEESKPDLDIPALGLSVGEASSLGEADLELVALSNPSDKLPLGEKILKVLFLIGLITTSF